MTYATAWDCTTSGLDQSCIVTATTSDDTVASSTASTSPETGTSTPYTGMSFHESLFLGCAILFFVSFIGWRFVFRKP